MKYDIDINPDYNELTVVIKAPEMTSEVTELMTRLQKGKHTTIGW
ncbi:MAG: hypothetical protein PF505_00110 [Vallitaleaceae bacterium]|jgi:hypothetical protein|nr:hypothetical protein [Vallitaleaceae bacterium]